MEQLLPCPEEARLDCHHMGLRLCSKINVTQTSQCYVQKHVYVNISVTIPGGL